MMNMKLLAVVTRPYIYLGCSTRKLFWKGKCTGDEKLFSVVNMKNCGRRNISKHREIKGSYKYAALDVSIKTDSLENIKMASSESKETIGKIRKGVD